jgi:hypothetical protein
MSAGATYQHCPIVVESSKRIPTRNQEGVADARMLQGWPTCTCEKVITRIVMSRLPYSRRLQSEKCNGIPI